MEAGSENVDLMRAEAPRLLAFGPLLRLPGRFKLSLALLATGVLVLVAFGASVYYPSDTAPRGSELQARIAGVFGQPEAADDRIVGDYLVERFYAIDVQTGERYVADMLKGRVTAIQASGLDSDRPSYTLVLDLTNLRRDQQIYAGFVAAVAPPPSDMGDYLGLRALSGLNDAFPLNYDGTLPDQNAAFRGPGSEGLYEYLLSQRLAEVTTVAPQIISVDGYNYLLSSSERQPFFGQFGVSKAVFLSVLILVDGTAPKQQATFLSVLMAHLPKGPR